MQPCGPEGPGALCPGALCPGALCPGALCPGALCPGALWWYRRGRPPSGSRGCRWVPWVRVALVGEIRWRCRTSRECSHVSGCGPWAVSHRWRPPTCWRGSLVPGCRHTTSQVVARAPAWRSRICPTSCWCPLSWTHQRRPWIRSGSWPGHWLQRCTRRWPSAPCCAPACWWWPRQTRVRGSSATGATRAR